ncbi:chaperonin 10-like protein [Talaromyces proteolyticus]|uniref:Chaperonin 10-like protein n=1 Tax=Talaromyces proteolyticus TaxID=1131652 RepID=A0AAD4PW59_9EURO|nr:chaperonin 10-like protein [Talaromyces proteolyticus]KAH8691552.1 chaperonin 10-like protein [Talaromyces proteolyticus]
MATQRAVVITLPHTGSLVSDRPIPTLRDDCILVKTVSVAVNPADWKLIAFLAPPAVLVGSDYSGVVEAVGKDVKKEFSQGDRVCGFVHGCNAVQPEDGAFAEYIVAKGDLQMKIPDSMSFQEAATLGAGINTVGQVYKNLELNLPNNPIKNAVPILIYAGSTATGTLAIQFAKLSGYMVLTTCSPHNFDLVRRLGADAVFDYKDPEAAKEIRKYTNNNLKLVLDCISDDSSTEFCDNALSTEGGKYNSWPSVGIERSNVNSSQTIVYTSIGEAFELGPMSFPAKPEDKAFAEEFLAVAEPLLAEGKIKVHPAKLGKGGLQGVLDGLQQLKEGKVSGEKLVYNVGETR